MVEYTVAKSNHCIKRKEITYLFLEISKYVCILGEYNSG